MELITIIFLIILALILLVVEFMLVPGISIAGIGSLASFVFAVLLAFKDFGNLGGFITLGIILILVPSFLYYFFKGKGMKRLILNSDIQSKVENFEGQSIQVGDMGKTIGRLAPAGKARINGQVIEVRSTGAMVDPNIEIEVIKTEGNTIIVKPLNS
jgi:membrane-bound ClpP family serine protease